MTVFTDKRAAAVRDLKIIAVYQRPICAEVYSVAPCTASLAAGSECYNTRKTCQDPANYNLTTQDIKFTLKKGLPIAQDTAAPEVYRPYIRGLPLETPAKIDQRTGETASHSFTMTMFDEPDNDVGLDPYLSTRGGDPLSQSTFWEKELQRNPFYVGRKWLIKRGFDDMLEADYNSSAFFTDSIKKTNGRVEIKLKDILDPLKKKQLPEATDGVTVGATTAGAASIIIDDETKYKDPAVTGRDEWVRGDDNIIKYTGISVQGALTGCVWQEFDTAQADMPDGTLLQQCFGAVAENGADILHRALNDLGIADADINVTELEAERDTWLQAFIFTGIISEPSKGLQELAALNLNTLSNIFWDEETQKVRFKVFAPPTPTDTVMSITDADMSAIDSDNNEAARISDSQTWYARRTGISDIKETDSFASAFIDVDGNAESDEQYGTKLVNKLMSRWITSGSVARTLATKRLNRFVNPPKKIMPTLEMKSSAIKPGDIVGVTSTEFIDFEGIPIEDKQVQVTSRKQISPGKYMYEMLDAAFNAGGVLGGKYAFIAPAGQADWDSATDEEKKYAYIGDATNNQLGALNDPGFYIY